LERLVAGAKVLTPGLHRQHGVSQELKHLAGDALSLAHSQPRRLLTGDGPEKQPRALVGQVQLDLPVGVGLYLAVADLARLGDERGGRQGLVRHLSEEAVEAPVGIRIAGAFLGRLGKVGAADAPEKSGEVALAQQVDRRGPVVDAGQGQLVEGLAGDPRGKNERRGKGSTAGIEAVRAASAKRCSVPIAVERLGRVDPRTRGAGRWRHHTIPLAGVDRSESTFLLYCAGKSVRKSESRKKKGNHEIH